MKKLLSKSISLILTYLNNDNNHTFNENLLNKVNAVDNERIVSIEKFISIIVRYCCSYV